MQFIPRSLSTLLATVLLAALSPVALAQGKSASPYEGPSIFLQQFDAAVCAVAMERQLEIPLQGNPTYCLMVFDPGDGPEYEATARVRVNDDVVLLRRVSVQSQGSKGAHGGPRTVSRYLAANKAVSVILDVETINDNCGGVEDKCCGAYYEGVLNVVAKRQRTSYPVYFYRGG